eukprot:4209521-Pleurochrysis_carterae.AAC.3
MAFGCAKWQVHFTPLFWPYRAIGCHYQRVVGSHASFDCRCYSGDAMHSCSRIAKPHGLGAGRHRTRRHRLHGGCVDGLGFARVSVPHEVVGECRVAVVDERHQNEQHSARCQSEWQIASCFRSPPKAATNSLRTFPHGAP